jgi:acetyl esterase/lipase
MGCFWANYLGTRPAGHPLPEPLHTGLNGLPLYLMLAAVDALAHDARELARCLADAGVPHEVREYSGPVHGFLQMTVRRAPAHRALVDIGRALNDLLR